MNIDWRTIPASEVGQHPTLVRDLITKKIDGVTVTGVFTPEESADAVARITDEMWKPHFIGAYIGMALGMIPDEEPDRSSYLAQVGPTMEIYRQVFGYDPHERLRQVLAPGSDGLDLRAASEDGQPYLAGQLRWWEPGKAGLKAHVGNEFRRACKDSGMKHLLTTTTVADHLSYFIVLQPPDQGGVLSVYDVLWDDDDAMAYDRVDLRDDSAFDDLPCLKLNPGAGDLILFGGGWRWHRVDPLTGSIPRVTYGGFAGLSLDGAAVEFWA